MGFLRVIAGMVLIGSASFSLTLFAGSAMLLVAGIAMQSRARAMRLRSLEDMPLSKVEFLHPHLPSPRIIAGIGICAATLLLAALQTVQGAFPFTDPYQGLNLASFFLVGASAGILAELRWRGAKDYAFAVILGTALAFLCIIIQFSEPQKQLAEKLLLIALLLPSLVTACYVLPKGRRHGPLLTLIITCAVWVGMYLLR